MTASQRSVPRPVVGVVRDALAKLPTEESLYVASLLGGARRGEIRSAEVGNSQTRRIQCRLFFAETHREFAGDPEPASSGPSRPSVHERRIDHAPNPGFPAVGPGDDLPGLVWFYAAAEGRESGHVDDRSRPDVRGSP